MHITVALAALVDLQEGFINTHIKTCTTSTKAIYNMTHTYM